MADKQDIALKIRVVDSQGKFRGGTVDIDLKHRTLSDHAVQRGVDASREIAVSGLRRAPVGGYQVTVTPTDVFKPQSQFVNIPASGFAEMTVVIDPKRDQEPKPAPAFVVKGTVHTSDGAPFARGLVRAVHEAPSGAVLLGEGRTDEQGSYLITYPSATVAGAINLRAQALDVSGKTLVQSDPVVGAKGEEIINLRIQIAGSVNGRVAHANGSPFTQGVVRAFDRDLRNEEPLGESPLGPAGQYQIRYSVEQFRLRDKDSADLVVKAFNAAGALIVTSPILFNAPASARIDLTIPAEVMRPPSLFEKINQTLKPLLEGLKVEELEEDQQHQDLSFLFGETGLEIAVLARFAIAHKLAQQAVQPEFWFALLDGSFFRFAQGKSLKEQLAKILIALPSLDESGVRKALARALDQQEIPEAFREKIDGWVEAFLHFVARQLVSPSPDPPFVKQALDDAGIKGAKEQEAFARLFNKYKELTPELLDALEKDASFKKEAIADLRTSFRLGEVTQADFSVIKMIKDEFGVRQPEKIRTLAKKSEDEWVNLVKRKHAAGSIKLPFEKGDVAGQVKMPAAEIYGKTLERQFRETFPTVAFVGGLERAARKGGARGLRRAETLGKFLDRHENFELLKTPVDDFLQTSVHPDFQPLAKDEQFGLEVKAVQRVFKLAPTFEETDTLLADDLHSAQQVYRVGETEFVERYAERPGFTADSARQAWNRAADTHAAVLTILADLKGLDPNALPQALKSGDQALASSSQMSAGSGPALSSFPNWNNLFQGGDLCECEHCRSVLSPAAYFADLLMFLKDRKSTKPPASPGAPNPTVKDILFERRADLGYLELNCDNALTPLPYVDVVCEVLEDVVAGGENDLALSLASVPTDDTAKTAVASAFANAFTDSANNFKQKIALGDDLTLSQVKPSDPNKWVVHTGSVTYLLKKNSGPNFFAEILRNTKASAAELRSYPQYVNPRAYKKLREAKYPLALPFDLYADEVRAAFQKVNLQRWDLMRTLRGSAAPLNPDDGQVAAEYFGISVAPPTVASDPPAADEKSLILVAAATVAGQQEVWGENDAAWLDTVGNVKNFLQKTGLDYGELLTLLDLKFINPAGDITIQHEDASCDLDRKKIEGLSEQKLDRIHRFLRLWRKLKNWKMWMLDLVLNHPAIGNASLDENFLINLMNFVEVKNRLGVNVTVEQVAALFGHLNTATHFTRLHDKREDALYQKLFLDRRLINPLDPAFEIVPATHDLKAGETITAHQPVVLSALNVREADLLLLKGFTKTADGTPYVNNNLTLANLSFLWRHAWLSRQLKLRAEDWKVLLKLVAQPVPAFPNLSAKRDFLAGNYNVKTAALTEAQVDALLRRVFYQDVSAFASPKSALEFLEKIEQVTASGFTPDELSWLLAADRSAKAALKEEEATRFLAALRKELNAIHAEHDRARYAFLAATPPTDEGQLTGLLTTLLQKLNRSEAEVNLLLAALRGVVLLETKVQDLPAGFTFQAAITGPPNHIPIRYDTPNSLFQFTGMITAAQRTTLLTHASLAAVTGLPAYQNAIRELFQNSQAAPANFLTTEIDVTLPGGLTLPGDRPSMPIRYDSTKHKLRFTGLMTDAERLALIAAGNPASVIEELFRLPRLAMKFYEPIFTAPLASLPPAVNFKTQFPAELAAKIDYDAERRLLRFSGIMKSDEQAALNDPVPNVPSTLAYHQAVNDLAAQPQTIIAPDVRVWLTETDLDATQPENDTLAKRLANAAGKALDYLSKTLAANAVVKQSSTRLGLTEALSGSLLTTYSVLPASPPPAKMTLLAYLTGEFVDAPGSVDYATLKKAFDGWYWINRVATILKKWRMALEEFERLASLTDGARLLDFATLPLNTSEPIASLDSFLRAARLLRLRASLPETGISLLEVLSKLGSGAYPAAPNFNSFAADVERVNEAWPAADVAALIATLDLAYPADYLLAESWERVRRAFYFLGNLNAGPNIVRAFAAAAMTDTHVGALKELLRAKFGAETWMTLSAEIQDALRERKCDALAAYLLTLPRPANAPGEKWENSNDLYAYYLLDVEMSTCQLTSRLVQASGSVQLFVQRCFMGLEPSVKVSTDEEQGGSSAWRWWKWMRKYRVWEANRKVFLWPENWIEPELRKDRSPFFKDLENELLQNEIDQYSSETAFQNYLEKLDGVAQLEIAGFYHEDDGDNVIVHVFGRTRGTDPHLYYYRRYDYSQWTPWEKVELDIQGDYLIPAVINHRLFLFWPIFTEVADEASNKKSRVPMGGEEEFEHTPTVKTLRLQMAVSNYRQGKWTPKKVSRQFDESQPYSVGIERRHYQFYPIDRSEVDGRFGIKYEGDSEDRDGLSVAHLDGAFEITSCQGVPEMTDLPGHFKPAIRPEPSLTGDETEFLKWLELEDDTKQTSTPRNDFTLDNYMPSLPGPFKLMSFQLFRNAPILIQTPWLFQMTPAWHPSYFDKLWLDGFIALGRGDDDDSAVPLGTGLPFFYNDKRRTFFALPSFGGGKDEQGRDLRSYYPKIKYYFRLVEDFLEGQLKAAFSKFALSKLTPPERQSVEQLLATHFEEPTPPYTDKQAQELSVRYFMRPMRLFLGFGASFLFQFRQYHFKNFYHPFVCDFTKLIANPLKGIPALMSRETQLQDSGFSFNQSYQPTFWVVEPMTEDYYPKENVDFSPDGAYSPYNWELFFHIPLLIANSLSKNQRFEEARDWYHFIFNPIGVESAAAGGSLTSRYWITKPFFETTAADYLQQRVDNILRMLAGDTSVGGTATIDDLERQVFNWRTNPFEPHLIANYRTVAYQKTVVMKYLDNLVAWGDYLFRQDSMESINEATQLYILAAEILGPRPQKVPPQAQPPIESFNELENKFDKFSNELVQVENLIPALSGNTTSGADQAPLPMLYFCIPQNEKMLGYWDTVADRLYKIRHCMNIEGVVRQLALFEPPIDPAALVKAVAGGLDISAALTDLNAPLPLRRFNVLLQKANEVCNDVRALGSALLGALEKKDAEALGRLRQGHDIGMLEAVTAVRKKQIEEAQENLAGLEKSQIVITTKMNYYRDIDRITASESLNLTKLQDAHDAQQQAQQWSIYASIAHVIPSFSMGVVGAGGSPKVTMSIGGSNIGSALQAYAATFTQDSNASTFDANRASITGGQDRRWQDWKFQESLAEKELDQIARQIAAARVRLAVVEQELENHLLQIENARETDVFMRSKYTNEELYQWQVGQISGLYFQSYRLAYDLAKRAERCFRFELGLQDSSYINFGYWDSLKKGLLSGERLQYDLRRLETAYLEQHRREFELTKHVSLAQLDPLALIRLRETGRCFFRLPEEIFDLDYPGHYFRRIKSLSLTLPCVVGPYTTVSCTLRLLKNSIRLNTADGDQGYPRNTDGQGLPVEDVRFVENNIPVKAIAASSAQADSGVFELGFKDERYLPFEGSGVVSEWSLELFSDLPANNPDPQHPDFGRPLRQFDYNSISDAVVHVKYTAREDAGPFKNGAVAHLRSYYDLNAATPALRLLALRNEFPTQWERFLHPTPPTGANVFELEMLSNLFPIRDAGKSLKVNTIWLLARCTDTESYKVDVTCPLSASPPAVVAMTLAPSNQYGGVHFSQMDVATLGIKILPTDPPMKWQLTMTRHDGGNLREDPLKKVMEVEDVLLVLGYQWD